MSLNFLVMLVLILVATVVFCRSMAVKVGALLAAAPEHRFDRLGERFENVMVFMFGQKRLFKEPKSGIMHAIIFWGFCVVSLRTLTLFAMPFTDAGFDYHLPGLGEGFFAGLYAFTKDILEFGVLAMVIAAAIRRAFFRPRRVTPSIEAFVILSMIGTLMLTDFLFDGWRFMEPIASGNRPITVAMSPVGTLFAKIYLGMGIQPATAQWIGTAAYWIHCVTILTFMNLLPGSKHFHVITVFFNILFAKLDPPGAIAPIKDLEEQETFGVSKIEQFTWKQLLDLYTCTECGRCEVNCPAWHTGKPLSPKTLIKDSLENLRAHEARMVGDLGVIGLLRKRIKGEEVQSDPFADTGKPDLLTQVNEDVIWACTTCRSCEENCPLLISHVDKIIDMRRNLVLMESRFPKELGASLRNLETKSNPWGLPIADRANWLEDLGVPTFADHPEAEALFFVGCAGAYDERSRKVSTAVVKILKAAEIDFAVLGKEEGCTGDPARRVGNEYLFQMQAEQNIETMKGYNVKRVITTCPHCFNSIKNEYPQLGGNFDVEHYSDTITKLIQDGKIKPTEALTLPGANGEPEQKPARVAFHDSCYLGRYNEIYDAPRQAIQAVPGAEVVEMEKNRENGFCCGAGGARWLMEERIGDRVNRERVKQAMDTKPQVIASSCPFCLMMMEDGIQAENVGDKVQAMDIAELVAASLPSTPPS